MINFSQLKSLQIINYVGDSLAFGGEYTLFPIEETYLDESQCPKEDKGKLVIVEFMNNDTPMFFTLDKLDPKDWEIVYSNN